MSELTTFQKLATEKAADDSHHHVLKNAITSYDTAVAGMKTQQFRDWQEARGLAAKIKDYTLAHLPDLLESFEERFTARGGTVLWARDAEEARRYFLDIARKHKTKKVVKTKSMTTEEIDFNEFFEKAGLEVLESDLGELIVQLAGEKPYHIVTPAMHKTREEIAALFHDKLGAPASASVEELTMIARGHLREAYVTSEIGVTGANFLIADEGAVVMVENEGNGRLSMSCPPVHVVFAGLEKVIPRLSDLPLFLPLLSTSGTGQQLTCYNSIIRGGRQEEELDGPEFMYVILLDNGRSELYARETFREALRCIRCGACLNACPVYRTVGGHSYNTTYQGPIGSVITPHLRGLGQWKHLSFASSLCGACSDVCPVHIDLHHLLLENRWEANRGRSGNLLWKMVMRIWAAVMLSRRRLECLRRVVRPCEGLLRASLPKGKRRRVPRLAVKTFAQLWKERHDKEP